MVDKVPADGPAEAAKLANRDAKRGSPLGSRDKSALMTLPLLLQVIVHLTKHLADKQLLVFEPLLVENSGLRIDLADFTDQAGRRSIRVCSRCALQTPRAREGVKVTAQQAGHTDNT